MKLIRPKDAISPDLPGEIPCHESSPPRASLGSPSAIPDRSMGSVNRGKQHPALMPISLKGNYPPLFCVYGEPTRLALKLRKTRPVFSLDTAYNKNAAATVPTNIDEAVRIYIEAIQSVQPNGPYFLYGHCSGATIAYEIARQLLSVGQEVSGLYLVEPSANGIRTREKAKSIITELRLKGISIARLKSLLAISSLMMRSAPGLAARTLQLLWNSKTGRPASYDLRTRQHLRSIWSSICNYKYKQLGCKADFIYSNLDEHLTHDVEHFWREVTNQRINVHSIKCEMEAPIQPLTATKAHLAVLDDKPLQLVAAFIDDSLLKTD
ncbi:MAG: thioesterase domain-containing protein [Gammaproteobacteria bacterium]